VRVDIRELAPAGAEFAPEAFAAVVGTTVPMTREDADAVGLVEVVAAQVAADGRSVVLTLEVPDPGDCPDGCTTEGHR
jgi:hypothetical protein